MGAAKEDPSAKKPQDDLTILDDLITLDDLYNET